MFDEVALREYNLAKGSKLTVFRPIQGSLLKIKISEGKLHPSLAGSFTGVNDADRAVQHYLKYHYKVPRTSKNIENKVEEKQRVGKDLVVEG